MHPPQQRYPLETTGKHHQLLLALTAREQAARFEQRGALPHQRPERPARRGDALRAQAGRPESIERRLLPDRTLAVHDALRS